jgi:uncharacterized membrane protein
MKALLAIIAVVIAIATFAPATMAAADAPAVPAAAAVTTPADAKAPAAPAAASAPGTATEAAASLPKRVFQATGSLHPAAVHMPIALFTVAAMFIVLRRFVPSISPDVAFYCLVIGAVSAVGAAFLGLGFAGYKHYSWGMGSSIFWHRWGGIGVAILAMICAVIAINERIRPSLGRAILWQLGTLGVAGLVGLVGHQGGELVYDDLYGEAWNYVVNYEPPKPTATAVTKGDATVQPIAASSTPAPAALLPGAPIDFVKQIQPILEAKCVSCHGAEKKKGGLRLDTEELALKGGENGPAYVPGKPEESQIIKLITSTDDDEKMPPPNKNNKPLTPEEITILTTWVKQGAAWSGPNAKTVKVSAAPAVTRG